MAGEVGILVLDVQALNEAATTFIGQIKRQFPDLVVVVAGNRDDENSIAGLISAGIVYRFIHKPMSPGRAKLFADAAVKKYDDQRRRAAQTPPVKRGWQANRAGLIAGTLVVLALIIAVTWALQRKSPEEAGVPRIAAAPRPAAESPLLAQAAAALAANRLTEPAGDNALELYLQAGARNPADPKARAGLSEVRERLLAKAENTLLEERLDEAAAAIETARRSGVEGGRIAFLSAQLAKSRERLRTAQPPVVRGLADARTGEDRVTSLIALAAQRIGDGMLMEPERGSARFYVDEALKIDPASEPAQEVQRTLALRLLAEVRSAIDRRDFAQAARFIEAAKGIATPANCRRGGSLACRRAPPGDRGRVGAIAEECHRPPAAGPSHRTGR